MAADVSSLARVLNGYKDGQTARNESASTKSTGLITRDLLGCDGGGGSSKNDHQELDLDLQVPSGWEKRLDLKSGKVYLQRCNSPSSPSWTGYKNQTNLTVSKSEVSNCSPSPISKLTLNPFDESNLELKLAYPPSKTLASSRSNYQSVCTLDKVKFALEIAEKEPIKKRSFLCNASPSSSSSTSIREFQEEENEENTISSPNIAAGCPRCLSYVLVVKNNPKCPRCNSMVPMPVMKKPRIDLNISI